MQWTDGSIVERVGTLIIEGQRHLVDVASTADGEGTWHNVLLFQRDGVLSAGEAVVAGLDWHVPPGIALARAREMQEAERIELYQRALRPRPPIV